MGAYLSQPNTEKTASNGGNESMLFGFAAMQGWRVSMEDAHNCIPELDDETAMFAVYDGHGGEEVALYCSKYLPDVIKEQKAYKDGKLQKALEDAFLAIDARITTEEVIKELVQIAGRPQEETEKVADEDDVDNEEAALLHEEATMTIEELLSRFGQNQNKNAKKPCPGASKESEEGEKSRAEKGINGETESGASEADSNGKEKAAGAGDAAGGSKMRACRRAAASEGGSASDGSAEKSGSTGDAGPSCSSSAAPAPGSAKSKFFDDCEESEEGEDEEDGSEEEDCSEEDGEHSSENDEEDDTEEGEEEDSDEEEDMCLPGMDGKEEPGSDSGTTAVVALIRGKQLIVANAGDSRCVVSEKGKAVDMSYDHKPEDELELTRIKNAGGKVTMDGRVNGGLNLSRAIGDHFYKRNKALPPEEQMISALPDVKVLTLNEDHEFMVIACDGICVLQVVNVLLDHCLAPDTSGDGTGCDNMTCIIITFSPHLGSNIEESTKKRKPEEENGNDSKKSKTE
uniref:protein-serine/threonine phosphatase n=1 Tax=Sinocyclocheilus rhinocerous TaxID=307959 RepID=A0A673HC37_9TELE